MDLAFAQTLPLSAACVTGDVVAVRALCEILPMDDIARGVYCVKPSPDPELEDFYDINVNEMMFDFKVYENAERPLSGNFRESLKPYFYKTALYLACENNHGDCAEVVMECCPDSVRYGMMINGYRYFPEDPCVLDDVYKISEDTKSDPLYCNYPINVACRNGLERVVYKMLEMDKSLAGLRRVQSCFLTIESPLISAMADEDVMHAILLAMDEETRAVHVADARAFCRYFSTSYANLERVLERIIYEDTMCTIIQRAWRRVISDPEYQMCRRRLLREFEESIKEDY